MKQLNFRHCNTNSKTLTITVNVIQKETNTAPKRLILFCLVHVYQEVFGHFPTILDHFGRFHGRLPKISEEKYENFDYIFVVIFTA